MDMGMTFVALSSVGWRVCDENEWSGSENRQVCGNILMLFTVNMVITALLLKIIL